MSAMTEHRRVLDALALVVHQGRISPEKLKDLRQEHAQGTDAATACIEVAFYASNAGDIIDTIITRESALSNSN